MSYPEILVLEQDGLVLIRGDFVDERVVDLIMRETGGLGSLPLIIADPPYGNVVPDHWDKVVETDAQFARWMVGWTKNCEMLSAPGAALYVWGGIGKPREKNKPPFRPFARYCIQVENETGYSLVTPITWAKKRGYGIQWSYLFVREEIAYLTLGDAKHPRRFVPPLLDEKRGYAGYNPKYPAKSEYFRRTSIWSDVTEILKGKRHTCEKPIKLAEIMILAHTLPGEWVLDPFAGSGSTGHAALKNGRRCVLVERDLETFLEMAESFGFEIPESEPPHAGLPHPRTTLFERRVSWGRRRFRRH